MSLTDGNQPVGFVPIQNIKKIKPPHKTEPALFSKNTLRPVPNGSSDRL